MGKMMLEMYFVVEVKDDYEVEKVVKKIGDVVKREVKEVVEVDEYFDILSK